MLNTKAVKMTTTEYKIVRDKVPEQFEKNHGKAADTRNFYGHTEELFFSRRKVREEVEELLTANTEEDLFEEAADVLESVISFIELETGSKPDKIYRELMLTAAEKASRLGTMSRRTLMRITDEDKRYYYNNIKGKLD